MPSQTYTAFISYSHQDGETFAEELKKRIANDEKGKEVSFWYDITNIHMGTWNRQIEIAIEQCEFLIMVITPKALLSPNCKDEWIYARKKGVMIMPVNGLPDDKEFYKQFPKWLEPQHIYNLEKQWQRFINDLTTRPIRQPIPFMARRLAEVPNYVLRENMITEVKKLLLDENENKISLTTSLQGSGGFGKTTLAIALCNDDEVINTFSDGILWVTLGQQPDILNSFKKLYEGLTGEQKAFIDIENARQKLQEAFEKRNCLLVIDDAWRRQDVKPLIDAATGVTVLITTRITNLLHVEKYEAIRVDEMQTDEGTKLLTALFSDKVLDHAKFREFSKKLGEWPLLLKLAGAQIQQRVVGGETPEQSLSYVQKKLERKGLQALDFEESDMRDESVRICMNASIDLLNQFEKDALVQLGIFPEDALIPISVIQQLWELDEFDTEELLKKLERQALLDIQLVNKTVTIHDILLQYYSENLRKNGQYEQLQFKLVNSLGDFRTFKHNYAFRNYIWHLIEAGELEQAKTILLDFDWIELKLVATDVNSVLLDYQLLNKNYSDIDLLLKAIKSSAYILADDKNQLPVQLIGRLGNLEEPTLVRIARQAEKWNKLPWMKPLISSMNPPTVLENVVKGISNPDVPFLIHEGKIIFADWQTSIHIVTLDTGRAVYSFTDHERMISALMIYNGKLLVSGDGDGYIKIYDLENNDCIYSERVSNEYISRLVPYKNFVLAGSGDGKLIVMDMMNEFEMAIYQKHTSSITSISFLDDYVISACPYDETMKVYPLSDPNVDLVDLKIKCEIALVHGSRVFYMVENRVEIATIEGNSFEPLSSITLRNEGSYHGFIHGQFLVTSAGDDVIVINTDSEEVHYLEGHTNMVTALCAKDNIVMSGSFDNKLKVWSLETFEEIKTYLGHSYLINQIEMAGSNILSLEKNGQLFFWRYVQPVANEEETDLIFYAEAYSLNKDHVVYARKNQIAFFDLKTLQRQVLILENDWTSFEIDDQFLFLTETGGMISKIDIAKKEILFRKEFGVHLIIGSHGDRIITREGSEQQNITFWDKASCELPASITISFPPEIFIELPQKNLLLAQPYSNEIEIRNTETLEEVARLQIADSNLKGVSLHGDEIITILESGVFSYNSHTFQKKVIESIPEAKDSIKKFYPGEKYLAVAFKDHTLKIFDKDDDFLPVQTFDTHTTSVEAIKILKNTVIIAGYDRQVSVWRIDDGKIVCSLIFDEIISHIDFNHAHNVVVLFGFSGRLYFMRPTGFEY